MAAKKAAKDTGIRSAPNRKSVGDTTNVAGSTDPGATEEVVVTGRRLATAGGRTSKPLVVNSDSPLIAKGGYEPLYVKAIHTGYHDHKRRRVGEVFQMYVHKDAKELPSWVIDLADAEPGQDEGTRGLHSGGREDDRIREERQERVGKGLKKDLGKGAKNVVDPTIINDSLPLTEGGNERKPTPTGNESVI